MPVTHGHEFCGVLQESPRAGFAIGDHVTAEQVVPCYNCLCCKKGKRWLCLPHDIFGSHTAVNGGLEQYMLFPGAAIVQKLPRSLPAAAQVYVAPLSCAVHGVERGDVQLGNVIVVDECGPIGLGMIAATRRLGPGQLLSVDCSEGRLEIARECGVDVVVGSVLEMTGGYGCDVYLEASGSPASVRQGLSASRKGATLSSFPCLRTRRVSIGLLLATRRSLRLRGGIVREKKGYEVAIDMLEKGLFPVERIVSHSLPLADVADGIGIVSDGTGSVKITIDSDL